MVKNNNQVENKEEKRHIPLKNYVIVAIIFIVTIGLALFLNNWYQSYQDYQQTIPILKGVLSEIRYNEIDNYINDNPNSIIYVGVADDMDCRKVEEDLKDIIVKHHLKDKIVYFNITDVSNRKDVLTSFNNQYVPNGKIYTYPAIAILDEGEVIAYKSKSANKDLVISDIEQLFEEYEVYGD